MDAISLAVAILSSVRLISVVAPLVLTGCALAGTPAGGPALYALRCHDIDATLCRERAEELLTYYDEPGTVVESIDIGDGGYGVCFDRPAAGVAGCVDGVYPAATPSP